MSVSKEMRSCSRFSRGDSFPIDDFDLDLIGAPSLEDMVIEWLSIIHRLVELSAVSVGTRVTVIRIVFSPRQQSGSRWFHFSTRVPEV